MAKIIPCLSLRQLSLRAAEDGIINNHPFPSIVPVSSFYKGEPKPLDIHYGVYPKKEIRCLHRWSFK